MDMPKASIPWWTMAPREEVFTWHNSGNNVSFATDRLAKHLDEIQAEQILIPVDRIYAMTLPRDRGLEKHRLDRIPNDHKLWTPIMLLKMDNESLLVDGNHRYYKAYLLGMPFIRAYHVDQDIWANYIVDFPESHDDPARGWSGIR